MSLMTSGDDGVTSKPTTGEVIDLIKRNRSDLALCKLRLHKIASSSVKVMKAVDVSELAKDLRLVNFDEGLPVQRSLGSVWDLRVRFVHLQR